MAYGNSVDLMSSGVTMLSFSYHILNDTQLFFANKNMSILFPLYKQESS